MKSIDETGINLCKLQGEIFEASFDKTNCSSAVFIRRFMNSKVALRIDQGSFLFEAEEQNSVFDEIDAEYGHSAYGKEKFAKEELYWIGYIYRYWCYTYNKSSKSVYKKMSANDMRGLYFPYHSLDPQMAIERIYEAHNLSEDDQITAGVKILRKIMKENGKL